MLGEILKILQNQQYSILVKRFNRPLNLKETSIIFLGRVIKTLQGIFFYVKEFLTFIPSMFDNNLNSVIS